MPLLDLKCACGNRWQALKSFSTADPSVDACPECGNAPERDYTPRRAFLSSRGTHEPDPDHMDPLERQFLMENRQWHEEAILAGDRGRGAVNIEEKGPAWSRPFGNDPMARKRAIEERGYSPDGY